MTAMTRFVIPPFVSPQVGLRGSCFRVHGCGYWCTVGHEEFVEYVMDIRRLVYIDASVLSIPRYHHSNVLGVVENRAEVLKTVHHEGASSG